MNDEVREILTNARALIQKGWCKGTMAKDKFGHDVASNSSDAVCFCTMGAIKRAAGETWYLEPGSRAFNFVAELVPGREISVFNDSPTTKKSDILALFDRALAQ